MCLSPYGRGGQSPAARERIPEFTSNKAVNRAVVTERYRYAEWPDQGEVFTELYDLQTDPWETVNLADNPQHAAVRDEMAGLLNSGWPSAAP